MTYPGSNPVVRSLRSLFVATIRKENLVPPLEKLLAATKPQAAPMPQPKSKRKAAAAAAAAAAHVPEDAAEFMEAVVDEAQVRHGLEVCPLQHPCVAVVAGALPE